jgi:periplasmic protein CpxP/Spy
MISIKKTTTLWAIIAVLALINIATLGSLWLSQPAMGNTDRPRPHRQGFFIEQRLNFTEKQAEEYRQMRQEYFEKARPYFEEIKQKKRLLYQHMQGSNGTQVKDVAHQLGQLQAELEMLTFEHFTEVRDISNDDQKIQLDSLMERMLERAVRPFPRGEGMRERHGNRP